MNFIFATIIYICIMNIREKLQKYPGTIPFYGFPMALEIDNSAAWSNVDHSKDAVIKLTFPEGKPEKLIEKAIKCFEGELISEEEHLIIIKSDLKQIGYILAFTFREQYLYFN